MVQSVGISSDSGSQIVSLLYCVPSCMQIALEAALGSEDQDGGLVQLFLISRMNMGTLSNHAGIYSNLSGLQFLQL